jgi:cation:H+ antiporter
MAIGNLIGSNIFNILAVLGFTALITPIPLEDPKLLNTDYWWMLAFAVILAPLVRLGKQNNLGKLEGAILFLSYTTYVLLQYL